MSFIISLITMSVGCLGVMFAAGFQQAGDQRHADMIGWLSLSVFIVGMAAFIIIVLMETMFLSLARRMRARQAREAVKVNDDLVAALRAGRCPDCASDTCELGPRGGVSQNIRCTRCGSRFNVGALPEPIFHVERI